MAPLYTRSGDKGTTLCFALGSGGRPARVSKSHPLIEFLGALDEANSFIGLARSLLKLEGFTELDEPLRRIQRILFNVGFTISSGELRSSEDELEELESYADRFYGEALRRFVLPYGGPGGSALHVARTVVRRAERRLVAVMESGFNVDPLLLKILNRASDALFAMAVYVARKKGVLEEV